MFKEITEIKFSQEEIDNAKQKIADYNTILDIKGHKVHRKLELSTDELFKFNFISSGRKTIKYNNLCAALHVKNKRYRGQFGDFLLNHEDYSPYWELKDLETKEIKYIFYSQDLDGYKGGEGDGISETWNNYKFDYLSVPLKRVWNSNLEKGKFQSLEGSNL